MARTSLLCAAVIFLWAASAVSVSVFYSSPKAHALLRSRRANSFLEEIKPPSLERECMEELCDFEEAREIHQSREATLEFWTVYADGNQCLPNACQNGFCVDQFQSYMCQCNHGFEGKHCHIRSTHFNCSLDNGGCDHDCFEKKDKTGRYCTCVNGYRQQENGLECAPISDYKRFIIEGSEMTISVSRIVSHPNYDSVTVDNDIALLRLATPVKLSMYIVPACLPSRELADRVLHLNGTMTVVTGWGMEREGPKPYSSDLKHINIPLVEHSECARHMVNNLTQNVLCAGSIGSVKDACKGDSGGPMMTLYRNTWFLVGLVSWGEGCGHLDKLGIYTKVANYVEWIEGVKKEPLSR
ncbi:vitamin K-dependent protein C isoform X2 [Trichomycterus rosablanca]|uniref:vitamin K-dependent protein C isoform X2 n=1 Tax=Trichomycterus rosablanca TaxID=2290929 RepID=UPI002F35D272